MRNYPQANQILKEIKRAKNIIINVHRRADLDAVGSALAFYRAFKKLGKKIRLISPEAISEEFFFLKGCQKIQPVDFSRFDFSSFDLFVILDSSSSDVVTGSPEISLPKIPKIIIDHHKTNKLTGKVRLVDEKASAVGEIIYQLFCRWNLPIDKPIANCLFASIVTDTVFLRYPRQPERTFAIVYQLIKKGADINLLVNNLYNNYSISGLRLLGLFLKRMRIDKKRGFVWSAVSHREYEKFGKPQRIREMTADLFFQSVKGTDFGVLMVEEEKGKLAVSFRSKGRIDVSKLAEKLGGGGHQKAAGATLYGKFEQMVEKVIATGRLVRN